MSMTHEEAARILDPETSAKALREYGDGNTQIAACDEACRIAADVLRNKPAGEALTPEQLRKMDGQPVFVKMKTIHELTGWAIVHVDYQMGTIRLWGKIGNWLRYQTDDMEIYAYPPAHIDREAWEPCEECEKKNCDNCLFSEYLSSMEPCKSCCNAKKWKPISRFCSECGRPLTDEAWAELEKRMGVKV